MQAQLKKLLDEIISNPNDDNLRIGFADVLESIGGEVNLARAEFIRLQLEWVLIERRDNSPQEMRSVSRSYELQNKYRKEFVGELADYLGGIDSMDITFMRGFVARVTLTDEQYLAHHGKIFDLEPIVLVTLNLKNKENLGKVVNSESIKRITALDLSYQDINDEGVGVLADSLNLNGLRWLGLSGNPITLQGVKKIANSPYLNLRYCNLGDTGCRVNEIHHYPDGGTGTITESWMPTEIIKLEQELGRNLPWLRAYPKPETIQDIPPSPYLEYHFAKGIFPAPHWL